MPFRPLAAPLRRSWHPRGLVLAPSARLPRYSAPPPPGAPSPHPAFPFLRRAPPPLATDYDAPRKTADDLSEDSLEELKARRAEAQSSSVDVDETELAEALELPGADLSGEELTVKVLPKQSDEFTCSSCFLVHHRSQLASAKGGRLVCRECS